MKKVMATMLAAATAATMLSGCGSSNSGSTETKAAETTAAAESGAKAEETTAADAAADGEKKEIYLLIRARGDLSYWDSMADGADRAAVDFADQANVHVIETTADNQANLTAMYEAADKGADMIITAGDFIDNMVTVAEEYPEISFLMVNEKMEGYDNVYAIDFSTSQAGFLAGIAAADVASQGLEGTSGNKTVGFIGGMDEVTVIEEFFIGYIQGVKYYDPETTVVYNYVGDWGNPDKGRTQALAQYNDMNADVIFACGPMPMLRALKEYAEKNGIEAYISLEERMACGVGACLGCVCKTKEVDHHSQVKNTRICTDGPVYDAREVEI